MTRHMDDLPQDLRQMVQEYDALCSQASDYAARRGTRDWASINAMEKLREAFIEKLPGEKIEWYRPTSYLYTGR